jgi:hypothetical protein
MLSQTILDEKRSAFLAFARSFSGVRISQPINVGRNGGTVFLIKHKSINLQLAFNNGRISLRVYDRKNRAFWTTLTGRFDAPEDVLLSCYDLSATNMVEYRTYKTGKFRHLAVQHADAIPKIEAFFGATLCLIEHCL